MGEPPKSYCYYLAAQPDERLYLVQGTDLLPMLKHDESKIRGLKQKSSKRGKQEMRKQIIAKKAFLKVLTRLEFVRPLLSYFFYLPTGMNYGRSTFMT